LVQVRSQSALGFGGGLPGTTRWLATAGPTGTSLWRWPNHRERVLKDLAHNRLRRWPSISRGQISPAEQATGAKPTRQSPDYPSQIVLDASGSANPAVFSGWATRMKQRASDWSRRAEGACRLSPFPPGRLLLVSRLAGTRLHQSLRLPFSSRGWSRQSRPVIGIPGVLPRWHG